MSTVIAKNVQIGTSGTATDNFTIFQPVTPDGTLRIGNGNTGITTSLFSMTSAGAVSLSGAFSVAGNNISAVNSLGFRNRIINGDMRIDQRNAGASITPTTSGDWWGCDRWRFFINGASSKFSTQQSTGAPAGFVNSTLVTSLSAYSVASTDNLSINQMIEGLNVSDLSWGTASAQAVTLSFWVRSSLTGTFGGSIKNSASDRSYPFSYAISAANTWEQKTVTIAGDTTGTWLTTNGVGIRVGFNIGSGSTFLGTANSWQSGNFVAPTGAVSVVGTNGATFYITGVQLEAGSVATPFERRDYGRELIMCQRYYQIWSTGWSGVSASSGYQYSSAVGFKADMRTTPTFGVSSQTNSGRYPSANYFVGTASQYGGYVGYTAASSGGNDAWTVTGTASAEL
jgi:hypothetical protein